MGRCGWLATTCCRATGTTFLVRETFLREYGLKTWTAGGYRRSRRTRRTMWSGSGWLRTGAWIIGKGRQAGGYQTSRVLSRNRRVLLALTWSTWKWKWWIGLPPTRSSGMAPMALGSGATGTAGSAKDSRRRDDSGADGGVCIREHAGLHATRLSFKTLRRARC